MNLLTLVLIAIGTVVILLLVAIAAIDMAARIDWVEERWPNAFQWTKHRDLYRLVLLVAVFLLIVNWEELRRSVQSQQPDFQGVINQALIGDYADDKGNGCQFFINIAVKNLGTPSIAYGWQLSLDNPKISGVHPSLIPDGYTINNAGKPMAIFRPDMRIEERTLKVAIDRGTFPGGWLRFVVSGATPKQCQEAQKTVTFQDIMDRQYLLVFKKLDSQNTEVVTPSAGDTPFVDAK